MSNVVNVIKFGFFFSSTNELKIILKNYYFSNSYNTWTDEKTNGDRVAAQPKNFLIEFGCAFSTCEIE